VTTVSIIIPTYNEKDNLPILLESLELLLSHENAEIIVVDDNSPDETWKLSKQLEERYPNLTTIHRINQKGLSSAVLTGFDVAKGSYLFVIDADLQHDEKALLPMIEHMRQGTDLVIASRKTGEGAIDKKWSLLRRIISQGATWLSRIVVPASITDPMSGFFGIKKECYLKFKEEINPRGFKLLLEFIARMKPYRIKEVGYQFRPRRHGESKLSNAVVFEYLISLYDLSFIARYIPRRFIQYCMVGLVGLCINYSVIFLALNFLGFEKSDAVKLAIVVTLFTNFTFNDRWTFKSHLVPGVLQTLMRFVKYVTICSGGAFGSYIITMTLLKYMDDNIYLANIFGILYATIWNYSINTLITWRHKKN
jgi:dolichol-phosphate mannosyltransferase